MSRNERMDVEAVWDDFLSAIGGSWKQQEVVLVLDLTPFEEYAQLVYVGLMQQTRVLPLAWKVPRDAQRGVSLQGSDFRPLMVVSMASGWRF